MCTEMTRAAPQTRDAAFQHEALMYEGETGFMDGAVPFLREAIAADAPALVAVSARKIALLTAALGSDAEQVHFVDMAELGVNPGRIIPAWRDFAADHADARRLYGIGEPIWPGRSEEELVECHRHEALLNLAFADREGFRLMCPYDTTALAPEVVEEACRTHPHVLGGDGGTARSASPAYYGLEGIATPFGVPLPEPPSDAAEVSFHASTVSAARIFVDRQAVAAGVTPARREDLVLAVNELTTNSVRHGGGGGTLRAWEERDAFVCEVRDNGRIADPLAGRARPNGSTPGGFGLWIVHQLCDLVEVRTRDDGTVVRVRVARR